MKSVARANEVCAVSSDNKVLRVPAALQGWTLVSATWLAVMASAVIAPVLPSLTAAFKGTPRESLLVALVATLPALFVALLAVPFGLLADRIGRRKLLLAGLALYGLFGISPLWLHSLWQIVFSRVGVGITEAMVITAGTATLGDYFSGKSREHWFALQTGSANIIAILMIGVGGLLGERSWRAPFAVYALGFLLIPLVIFAIWEPLEATVAARRGTEASPGQTVSFQWDGLIGICLTTFFVSTAFYVVVVQLGFLLTERGISSPKLIGKGTGIAVLAMPLGAVLFRFLRARFITKLTLSLLLSSAGFFIVAYTHDYAPTVAGAALNDLGSGLALPTLMSWALSMLPPRIRGRGTGAWQSAFALGQFASPLIILGLASTLGGRSHAVLAYAWTCGLASIFALFLCRQTPVRPRLA